MAIRLHNGEGLRRARCDHGNSLADRRLCADTSHVDPLPPTTVPSNAPARLWSLDALRGLCALVVFLSHWHLWSSFPPQGVFESALHSVLNFIHHTVDAVTWPTGGHHPAVIAFFVLSGFCVHYPFERRMLAGEAAPRWRDYFFRRFRRIVPVYWTACVLGLIFVGAEALHPTGHPLLHLHALSSVEDLVVRFTGIAALYPKEIFAGNYILITVAAEIAIYAVYPLFYRFARRGKWRTLGLTFLGLHLASVFALAFVTPYWVFNSVFMLGIFWFAGAWAAHRFLTNQRNVKLIAVLAAWAVFLALKLTPSFYGLNLLKQAAWGLVCTFGLLWVLGWERRRPAVRHAPTVAALRWCGEISYSLYALHTPTIMLTTWALLHLSWTNSLLQLATTMGSSIIVVLLVHHGIERRFYTSRPEAPPST
jgi:peptidoglycan/LPS O-acetylase OafA/YrhL